MVKIPKKLRWDKIVTDDFRAAINYIRRDSIKNAEKVRKDLLGKINALKEQPEKYPLDKFKTNNDKLFRAFELHHYRVSYAVTDKEIVVTRIRHTSMEPLDY